MTRYIVLLLLSLLTAACQPRTAAPPEEAQGAAATSADATSKYIEKISNHEIRIADGAKSDQILGKDGALRGVSVIALDNSVTYITCECPAPGCAGNCKMEREDPTGSTIFKCRGTCSTSENNSCGACGFGQSPTPPTPDEFHPEVGVDIHGNEPAVERDTSKPQ